MWLRELIKEAQKAYEENGNIPVAVYADTPFNEKAFDSEITYLDAKGDELLPEDYYYEGIDMRKTKVFQINGDGCIF